MLYDKKLSKLSSLVIKLLDLRKQSIFTLSIHFLKNQYNIYVMNHQNKFFRVVLFIDFNLM